MILKNKNYTSLENELQQNFKVVNEHDRSTQL